MTYKLQKKNLISQSLVPLKLNNGFGLFLAVSAFNVARPENGIGICTVKNFKIGAEIFEMIMEHNG